jgi:hypothetical protein
VGLWSRSTVISWAKKTAGSRGRNSVVSPFERIRFVMALTGRQVVNSVVAYSQVSGNY